MEYYFGIHLSFILYLMSVLSGGTGGVGGGGGGPIYRVKLLLAVTNRVVHYNQRERKSDDIKSVNR